jgi:hypothetical protein
MLALDFRILSLIKKIGPVECPPVLGSPRWAGPDSVLGATELKALIAAFLQNLTFQVSIIMRFHHILMDINYADVTTYL